MESAICLALMIAYFLISDYLEILKIRAQNPEAPWECEDCNGCGACCTCEDETEETLEDRLARQDINHETETAAPVVPKPLDNNDNH